MQEGKGIRMVYDCIPFFNELDILNLRLHVLNSYVDKFIIEEATVTFSGEPKELCFEKNKEMFREFLPKIEYIVVDNSPVNTTTHLRDKFQKNALEKGLADAGENDMILLSDVDEIPNPRVLQELKQNFDPDKVYRIADGGWHFGYMGSRHEADVSKRIGDKVVAAAHQEYNKQDILAEAKYRLMLGEDMFGRDARFERVEVDDTYPEYLLQHRKDYEYLIMPPISKAKRNYIRISMKVKRFLRKVCRRIRRIFNR